VKFFAGSEGFLVARGQFVPSVEESAMVTKDGIPLLNVSERRCYEREAQVLTPMLALGSLSILLMLMRLDILVIRH
jgi:hypothetical protein